jgi:peptidoglycan hydrolase-like protein with peptidoglycan-binding domain
MIGGLQLALKKLDYRVTVDSDCGPETCRAVMGFRTHAGTVTDGITGAQTEAQLKRD